MTSYVALTIGGPSNTLCVHFKNNKGSTHRGRLTNRFLSAPLFSPMTMYVVTARVQKLTYTAQ